MVSGAPRWLEKRRQATVADGHEHDPTVGRRRRRRRREKNREKQRNERVTRKPIRVLVNIFSSCLTGLILSTSFVIVLLREVAALNLEVGRMWWVLLLLLLHVVGG